ncbi:MAG: PQQ-dependent sugar dehydrogenase [Myxococcota bacterium]
MSVAGCLRAWIWIPTLLSFSCAAATPRSPYGPRLERVVVLDGLRSPWSLAFINEETVLITEKEGELLRVDLRSGVRRPVRGLPEDRAPSALDSVRSDNSGLFEVLLAPDFPRDPYVYLSYAAAHGEGRTTKVVRGKLLGESLVEVETLFVAKPYTQGQFHHFGGGMTFGPDGHLYFTVGERLFDEQDEPPLPIAQDLTDRRGKIYRLKADGTIPNDNPDFGPSAVPGLWAVGIRAAQGLTVRPGKGEIWFSEHGTRQGDELNRLLRGANYGWPVRTTGGYRSPDYKPPSLSDRTFIPPRWAWLQTVAPTGLAFYDGAEFPSWQGDLLVGGLSRGSLWRVNFEDDVIVGVEELLVHDRIRTRNVAVSPAGAVYVLTDTLFRVAEGRLEFTGRPSGQLQRIVNARPLDR